MFFYRWPPARAGTECLSAASQVGTTAPRTQCAGRLACGDRACISSGNLLASLPRMVGCNSSSRRRMSAVKCSQLACCRSYSARFSADKTGMSSRQASGTKRTLVSGNNRAAKWDRICGCGGEHSHAHAQEHVGGHIGEFVQNIGPLPWHIALVVFVDRLPQKPGGDLGISIVRRQFVAGQLLLDRLGSYGFSSLNVRMTYNRGSTRHFTRTASCL